MTTNDRLRSRREAAEFLKNLGAPKSAATLATWASRGKHLDVLPIVRVGGRCYYRESDLLRMTGLTPESADAAAR